jgi:hypothetical protein
MEKKIKTKKTEAAPSAVGGGRVSVIGRSRASVIGGSRTSATGSGGSQKMR